MADHAKAFDKGTDPDKLAATQEQYAQRTDGEKDQPEGGTDPIIEATKEAIEEASKKMQERLEEEPPAYINPKAEGLSDEEIKANEEKALQREQEEGKTDEGAADKRGTETDVTKPDRPTAGTTTQEAESRAQTKSKS